MNWLNFLLRTRDRRQLHWTDTVSYLYLVVGLFMMFAPVVWLVMSSFKTEAAIAQFPPSFLPYSQKSVSVPGHDKPLPLFTVTMEDGSKREMVQINRIGIKANMVDPAQPEERISVNINQRQPVNELKWAWNNYTDLFGKFSFGTYLWNSVFITVVATALTLLFNSMAAFALSKYRFKGQKFVFLLIIATLMIPPTIILVPVFLVINQVGLLNSLWGVILPAVATPTGVSPLRQYMLTIPDELLEASKIDGAGPVRFFVDTVLPLSRTNIAALFVILFIYGWNQYLWPLLITTRADMQTIVIGIKKMIVTADALTEWQIVMATAMLAMIPPVAVVLLMQRWFVKGLVETEK